jgi:mannose-6-phosphate isomerase-like protein (cupin superfamily)
MQGLERTHEPLRLFTRQLASELSHTVQANAYLSPGGGAKGLARHADEHDVFVLQIEGAKQWDIDGLGAFTMTAGDVLYMPRGAQHAAHTEGAPSLHVTIGVATATYRDVLRRAVDRASVGAEQPVLDQRLPLGYARGERGANDLSDGIAAAVSELVDHLQHVKPDEIVDHEQARVLRQLQPKRSLRPAFDAAELTLATPVRAVESRPMSLSTELDQLVIDLDDRRIRMPLSALAAVQHLVEGCVTTPADLPDLSNETRLVVVRRLIREGAVVVHRED